MLLSTSSLKWIICAFFFPPHSVVLSLMPCACSTTTPWSCETGQLGIGSLVLSHQNTCLLQAIVWCMMVPSGRSHSLLRFSTTQTDSPKHYRYIEPKARSVSCIHRFSPRNNGKMTELPVTSISADLTTLGNCSRFLLLRSIKDAVCNSPA